MPKKSSGIFGNQDTDDPAFKIPPPDEFELFLAGQPDSPLRLARIPHAFDGIQLNFCKSPGCANYGKPPEPVATKGAAAQTTPNSYTVAGADKGLPVAMCNACKESFPLKSNKGIVEERNRLRPRPKSEASCPYDGCSNQEVGVSAGKPFYSSFGTTGIGSTRWKCMACERTFSVRNTTIGSQRASHKNKDIFKMLVNKVPIRRIAEMVELSPQTVYDKIDFIWRQCVAYAEHKERKLPRMPLRRLYIGVDKQDYAINWTLREDKRNVVLSAASFVDNGTGYAFGSWLNFDPSIDVAKTEKEAEDWRESQLPIPYRRHARLWTHLDYAESVAKSTKKRRLSAGLADAIDAAYEQSAKRKDAEATDEPTEEEALPDSGMQTHTEYLLYGSFLRLREMLASAEKVRFLLDQDSGMRAACLGAWKDRIQEHRCDAFYVRISKELTVDSKRKLMEACEEEIEACMASLGISRQDAILELLLHRIKAAQTIGKWKDRWVFHPLSTMSEPEKAICHLTDLGQYDPQHLAWLINKCSIHGVDSYFNRVRRRLSMLERGIHSSGNAGRVWNGYSPYRPAMIQKLLDIFRVCNNFIWTRDVMDIPPPDKETGEIFTKKEKMRKTPAMLLCLSKTVGSYEDVLYFQQR
jgi:transposase-like protein